jgi:hypothetical protein
MRASFALLALGLVLAARPALAHEDLLGPEGYGWIRIGMSFKKVQSLYHPLDADYPGAWLIPRPSDHPDACVEYEIQKDTGTLAMVRDARVSRVTITSPREATVKGVRVGDSEAAVRAAYDGLTSEPAPYAEGPAHDLYYWSGPGAGLRFEIDADGKVAAIHGGDESIRYMEGCL